MKSKIDVLRALSSIIAKRALLIIGIILTLIIIALLVTVSVLMNVSSAWWGLLLIIVIPCTLVAVIVFAILWFITRHLYTVPLNKHQKRCSETLPTKSNDCSKVTVWDGSCLRFCAPKTC